MSSISITFPDGNSASYPAGSSAMEVAQKISNSLAKKVLAAEVNGEVVDLLRPIESDCTLKLLTWDEEGGKSTFWHSSAHLLAEALDSLWPGIKFAIGPPIAGGFYYDIDPGENSISDSDFPRIEKRMKKLAEQRSAFVRKEVSKEEAIAFFKEKGDPYKLELLEDLEDGTISFYTQGKFTDLCRGPHLPDTSKIKAVKVLSLAGAYWRGDEKNKQLTRIYAVTFPKEDLLKAHLEMLEEAKLRDHRRIGKDLGIFTFDDDVGPGLPLWLPKGAQMIESLEELAKKSETEAGYQRVRTPHLAKENLYLTSGHLPYYSDSMFPPMELDGATYYLKAMNCPHHHKIFDAQPRSYKEMPIRLAEYGTCYRYEKSGELFGLMRVRSLQMNDAHIYCTKDQFEEEFKGVNALYLKYFELFGIDKYQMRFSTHSPEKLGKKYIDNPEMWKQTEDMVRKVLVESNMPFVEVADEAAFYGPKIDIQIWSAIGKEFTLATNQVDFAQPLSFDLNFINANNEKEHPIIIHRAPLSTHERFIGFLLEHYAGNFPLWLAPEQVVVLPISDKYSEYAAEVQKTLQSKGLRVRTDNRTEKIGRKIRDAAMQKIPYQFIVGEKEVESKQVSARKHGEGDLGSFELNEICETLVKEASI